MSAINLTAMEEKAGLAESKSPAAPPPGHGGRSRSSSFIRNQAEAADPNMPISSSFTRQNPVKLHRTGGQGRETDKSNTYSNFLINSSGGYRKFATFPQSALSLSRKVAAIDLPGRRLEEQTAVLIFIHRGGRYSRAGRRDAQILYYANVIHEFKFKSIKIIFNYLVFFS